MISATPGSSTTFVLTSTGDLSELTDAISQRGQSPWDYLTSGITFLAAVAIGLLLRLALRRLVDRSRADNLLGDLIGRMASYVVFAFGFVYALDTLGISIGPILGALGIVGIALAFAFQDILSNFVAGIILQLQRPFASGDEIQVRLPSAEVIKTAIVNHTQRGRRRTTLEVGVAYGTDLERATRILVEAVTSVEEVLENPPPEALVVGFGDSSIDFAVRYWHPPSIAAMWRSRSSVAKAVERSLAEADITIPFPQRVVHLPPTDTGG